jgi:hypothetical protein
MNKIVVVALLTAMFSSSLIHRVSVTVCLLLSMGWLYYMNKISHSIYSASVASAATVQVKKKK